MDRAVIAHAVGRLRSWFWTQAPGNDLVGTIEQLQPGGWTPTVDGKTLTIPAEVAAALVEWIRRARIEIAYAPANSERRRQTVQAAYVTETLVRAAHDGEVFLHHPKSTYTQIEWLRSMIELGQGIRRSEARCQELALMRPWLHAWRVSMSEVGGTVPTATSSFSTAVQPNAVTRNSLNRLQRRAALVFASVILLAGLRPFPSGRTPGTAGPEMPFNQINIATSAGSDQADGAFAKSSILAVSLRPYEHRSVTQRQAQARPAEQQSANGTQKLGRPAAARRASIAKVRPATPRRGSTRDHASHTAPSLF